MGGNCRLLYFIANQRVALVFYQMLRYEYQHLRPIYLVMNAAHSGKGERFAFVDIGSPRIPRREPDDTALSLSTSREVRLAGVLRSTLSKKYLVTASKRNALLLFLGDPTTIGVYRMSGDCLRRADGSRVAGSYDFACTRSKKIRRVPRKLSKAVRTKRVDVVMACDLYSLTAAAEMRKQARARIAIYDAREIYTELPSVLRSRVREYGNGWNGWSCRFRSHSRHSTARSASNP